MGRKERDDGAESLVWEQAWGFASIITQKSFKRLEVKTQRHLHDSERPANQTGRQERPAQG